MPPCSTPAIPGSLYSPRNVILPAGICTRLLCRAVLGPSLQHSPGSAGAVRHWRVGETPQWGDAVGMLHCDPFQREGETPGGQIAGNWGRIFDPVAAADFPALVR